MTTANAMGNKESNLILKRPTGRRISGTLGDDSIRAGAGNDWVSGGHGDDTIYGEAGNDTLIGGSGSDSFYENSGVNRLFGDNDDDTFFLSGGSNYADGGSGNDFFVIGSKTKNKNAKGTPSQEATLVGNSGDDYYVFKPYEGRLQHEGRFNPTGVFSIIENFKESNWGTIDLRYLNVNLVRHGNGPLAGRNNLYVKDTGNDILLRVVYADRELQNLDIYVKNTNWGNVSHHLVLKNPE